MAKNPVDIEAGLAMYPADQDWRRGQGVPLDTYRQALHELRAAREENAKLREALQTACMACVEAGARDDTGKGSLKLFQKISDSARAALKGTP